MIPIDRPPANETPPAQAGAAPAKGRRTLPPPEWTRPAGKGRTSPKGAPGALPRSAGERADEAWLRARVAQARSAGAASREGRAAYVALARWLGSRDRDLDEAIDLASAALAAADDPELRRELSSWLEGIGEPARAAAALKPIASMPDVEPSEAAFVLARARVLEARAGIAAAFEATGAIDPAASVAVDAAAPDREAVEAQIEQAAAGDPSVLSDALARILSRPLPSSWAAAPLGAALRALARSDPARAAVVARRALDVLGPRDAALRAAMSDVASAALDDLFAAAILERTLSSDAGDEERRATLAALADVRSRIGDDEGEARAIARAVRQGMATPEMDARLASTPDRPTSPDGRIWWLRARADRLAAGGDRAACAAAWRELGGALWDTADDREGALAAWRSAAQAAGSPRAYVTLADDVIAFWGAAPAFERLGRWVDDETDDRAAASIAVGAAKAASNAGERRIAFDLASRGVARSPLDAEALLVAEQTVEGKAGLAALSGLYDVAASRALGRFGRRAAHYRGARFFERAGEAALALKHAAQAFYAVPSEGAGFWLLARAAERAGDPAQAVRTIERVAEEAPHAAAQTAWFLRAAGLAGGGPEGAARRLDILLRAAALSPSVGVIERLRDGVRDVLGAGPEDDAWTEARVLGAMRAFGERLGGPDGARAAVACARAALELFASSEAALSFVERAFACDADVDEYEQLVPWGPAMGVVEGARGRVAALVDGLEGPFSNIGFAALRLLAAVAAALRDDPLRARIAVAVAARGPDDVATIVDADAAVRRFPALAEQLARSVPPRRRAEALCTAARARAAEGRHGEAAELFERAAELLDPEPRSAIEGELLAAWDAAGRGAESEARVEVQAASEEASPSVRADHWVEIASRREARGDMAGAVRAVIEACKLDPDPLERWSSLERAAELAGDAPAGIGAMEAIALRVDARGRIAVLKRLARAHERVGDGAAVEHVWRRILALDPDDEEADHALESIVASHGRFDELTEHLRRRADRLAPQSEKREVLRAVRLRLAAILEQRLGRIDEACDQLEVLLSESPDNAGALRYLADLLDRRGEPARAAPLWARAAAVEVDAAGRGELELRAARAAFAAGDLGSAARHARHAASEPLAGVEALAFQVEVARAAGADRDLGGALEALALRGAPDAVRFGDLLLEAAQAAARAGEPGLALERARRAAGAVPGRATPQLLARGLEYRLRGAGTPDEAQRTVEDLSRIAEPLGSPDAALRSFLFAEALDAVHGGDAGLSELEAARASLGDHPLVALGLAERYAARGLAAAAADAYGVALSGSLLDLRKTGDVALAAAEAAIRARRWKEAARHLDLAEGDEGVRAAAQAARRTLVAHATAEDRPTPSRTAEAVVEPGDPRLAELESAVASAGSPVARAHARLALGRARLERGDARAAEPLLWEALADGLCEAGDVLAPLVAAAPDRARDFVRLRRQQAFIDPGDTGRLEALRAAALADDDRVYAAAVEHVLRALDPAAGPLPPPPLAAQPQQPGIFALLTRPSLDAAGEALASIWEGAMHLFVREPASYGIAGVERLAPGAGSAPARLYEIVMRVLDLPRIPIVVRETGDAPAAQVALLSPPTVVLSGDGRDEACELASAIGYGLSATLPQNVLRLGLPRAEGRALVEALHAAFGPPEVGRRVDARAARLAQSFWQSVPPRTQRRLQQILGNGLLGEYDDLVARARQSGLRTGMFLTGDFGWTARRLLAEPASQGGARGAGPRDDLRALCAEVPMLADLLRLAVSPEYADARWHTAAPGARPTPASSTGHRFF